MDKAFKVDEHDELHADIVENEEVVEEAHDPENAEQQSIDSVAKTDDAIKRAPLPKTKGKMLAAMVDRMGAMSKSEMTNMYNSMMKESVEDEEEVEDIEEDFDTPAALKDLVESEATLSEEFKEKTALIFETALRSKLSKEVDRLEEQYSVNLAEEISSMKTDMVDKVDSYLNYVVESWMEENRVAIEQGLRTEIAEDFMGKLKDLFTESYIEVPETKVDLVDTLATTVEELEEKLNSAVAESMELSEEINSLKREAIIAEASKDLVDTQAEKLNALVEGVEFDGIESFAHKVETIKESFFSKNLNKTLEESAIEGEDETLTEEVSSSMAHYVKAIQKTFK